MDIARFKYYQEHGCNFFGNLVVVDYQKDMENDPNWGKFGAGVVFDYVEKAKKLVEENGYNVIRVCLSIPEYVVEVE